MDIVILLLEHAFQLEGEHEDQEILYKANKKGRTVLHLAAMTGNEKCVKLLVDSGGNSLNVHQDKFGMTALHVAVLFGKINTATLLAKEVPVLVNLRDQLGCTPFYHACTMEDQETAITLTSMLLEQRANPSVPASNGMQAIHAAVAQKREKTIAHLLGKCGLDVDAPGGNEKLTPLHMCAAIGNVEMIETLVVRYRASLTAESKDGKTALHLATLSGQAAAVAKLIELGADVGGRVGALTNPMPEELGGSPTGAMTPGQLRRTLPDQGSALAIEPKSPPTAPVAATSLLTSALMASSSPAAADSPSVRQQRASLDAKELSSQIQLSSSPARSPMVRSSSLQSFEGGDSVSRRSNGFLAKLSGSKEVTLPRSAHSDTALHLVCSNEELPSFSLPPTPPSAATEPPRLIMSMTPGAELPPFENTPMSPRSQPQAAPVLMPYLPVVTPSDQAAILERLLNNGASVTALNSAGQTPFHLAVAEVASGRRPMTLLVRLLDALRKSGENVSPRTQAPGPDIPPIEALEQPEMSNSPSGRGIPIPAHGPTDLKRAHARGSFGSSLSSLGLGSKRDPILSRSPESVFVTSAPGMAVRSPDALVNLSDYNGLSPLFYAVVACPPAEQEAGKRTIQFLVDQGASTVGVSSQSRTTVYRYCKSKLPECAKLLASLGADTSGSACPIS
eukprot:TRINITY_DN4123_c0_g1_i3.p1 TRINITY_DN4123_c0_g1~~TRINITY_DN4123_c0_g1_i3.p1  ORF type:complete len:677 (+),score=119.89 TRINITY_DN4123_c0_g1_i3:326-2356(+)